MVRKLRVIALILRTALGMAWRNGTQGLVDFAAVVRMLDILAKQGEQRRLQFLFELHDLDRDGYLNNNEMTDLMEKYASRSL